MPAPKASVDVYRLHPFLQITPFDFVLLRVLPFGLQD